MEERMYKSLTENDTSVASIPQGRLGTDHQEGKGRRFTNYLPALITKGVGIDTVAFFVSKVEKLGLILEDSSRLPF